MNTHQRIAEHRKNNPCKPGEIPVPMTKEPESILDILNDRYDRQSQQQQRLIDAEKAKYEPPYDHYEEQKRNNAHQEASIARIAKIRQEAREHQARLNALAGGYTV